MVGQLRSLTKGIERFGVHVCPGQQSGLSEPSLGVIRVVREKFGVALPGGLFVACLFMSLGNLLEKRFAGSGREGLLQTKGGKGILTGIVQGSTKLDEDFRRVGEFLVVLAQKFNRLLVESEGKLVGILSTSDVMRLVLSGQLELS